MMKKSVARHVDSILCVLFWLDYESLRSPIDFFSTQNSFFSVVVDFESNSIWVCLLKYWNEHVSFISSAYHFLITNSMWTRWILQLEKHDREQLWAFTENSRIVSYAIRTTFSCCLFNQIHPINRNSEWNFFLSKWFWFLTFALSNSLIFFHFHIFIHLYIFVFKIGIFL